MFDGLPVRCISIFGSEDYTAFGRQMKINDLTSPARLACEILNLQLTAINVDKVVEELARKRGRFYLTPQDVHCRTVAAVRREYAYVFGTDEEIDAAAEFCRAYASNDRAEWCPYRGAFGPLLRDLALPKLDLPDKLGCEDSSRSHV